MSVYLLSRWAWSSALAVCAVAAVGVWILLRPAPALSAQLERRIRAPTVSVEWLIPKLRPIPLTEELRARGYNECNPPDPIGLGPYRPYTKVQHGRLTIPQRGGHTANFGYDVLVHFHGHDAMRKIVTQVSRGIAYVGIDLGLGSGPYAKAFIAPSSLKRFRGSIERGLKASSGNPTAHIRHLALAAWSAGYGAINEILKHGDEGVDAVILLDGLHARFHPESDPKRGKRPVLSDFIAPTFAFAQRASLGEKLFFFSHSNINPRTYPSTARTATALLEQLQLQRHPVKRKERFPMTARAEREGFYLWSFDGRDQLAHCKHINVMAKVLTEILEPAWQTPLMDRKVPATPAPKLGGRPSAKPEIDTGAEADSLGEPLLPGTVTESEDNEGLAPSGERSPAAAGDITGSSGEQAPAAEVTTPLPMKAASPEQETATLGEPEDSAVL